MTGPQFIVRRLQSSDYDELLSVWKRAGLPSRPLGRDSRKEMERQMRLGTSIYLKAVVAIGPGERGQGERERIVGAALGTHDGRKGWVNRLAVLPQFQRLGVGSMLVKELEKRFGKMGLDIYCGLVETGNDRSMGFFRKLGYVKHDDIVYYSKRKSDKT